MRKFASKWTFLLFPVIGFLFLTTWTTSISATVLAGVTLKTDPFVTTEGNRFRGLCVDLLNEIQARTGINYSLYLVDDGLYGPGNMADGKMKGMIADVHSKKADFAIADLTVTSLRERYINFTEPFFQFSVSALVQRQYVRNIDTLEDFATKSNLSVGAFKASNTLVHLIRLKNVRTIRWLVNRIVANESNLVKSREEALFKVRHEPYAFVQEEPKSLHMASKYCDLKVLKDQGGYFHGRYAIAFRPDSPYLPVFSRTIKMLEREGFLAKLKDKYFNVGCLKNSAGQQTLASSVSIVAALLLVTAFANINRAF